MDDSTRPDGPGTEQDPEPGQQHGQQPGQQHGPQHGQGHQHGHQHGAEGQEQRHQHGDQPGGPAQRGLGAEAFEADPSTWFTQEFWDLHYGAGTVWSGDPNPVLVQHATALTPGSALDVGCGEGADAIWLARAGWTVTGADVSQVVLDRCAALARDAGPDVAARTRWQQADALTWAPPALTHDLVSAQFLHLPRPALHALHRRLAAAVRPGGTLLVVSHDPADAHEHAHRPDTPDMFVSAADMAGVLDPAHWDVEVGSPQRQAPGPDGTPVTVRDAVLRAVRRS
ncbi:bifunctional 2-polyprenyl-6-hydroxyphenol methylase/3-demethylubiquinol 3-O-methyltransferase UbiG [Modestobacter sp. Leaf380]|uniref:class I SAM-dependent methyltransferase n=1 Tax=Modestobacter sp. Leaf380 TaxID=1736356 RepID=UPI0009E9434E|nr:class I SAM-dependent methyltransferase [Modestobacter sp. Leaf380]